MELKAAAPIAFVREETGEILNAALASAIHEAVAVELVELMQRQPLGRKPALEVARKRVTALAAGLIKRAAEALESEWDQTALDLND
jgi:hypothetical protein